MKLTTTPKCPKYFKLNKNNCKCTIRKDRLDKLVKSKKTKKTKKNKRQKKRQNRLPKIKINPEIHNRRCPRGMYYNKEFQMCELDALNPKRLNKTKKKRKPKRKRLNIGTDIDFSDSLSIDFNTSTGDRKQITKKRGRQTDKVTVIKNKTPQIDRILGNFYNKQTKQQRKPEPLTKKKALDNLDRIVSFSPKVNRQLISMRTVARNTFDDCETFGSGNPKIKLKNGKCLPFDNPEVQDYMLTNLSSKTKTNCSKIIAPKQIASNCWFNTMFMSFFISDKGKKFFRFFRQLMIQGVNSRGVPIAKNLHIAFFKLNMAIEAVLGSQSNSNNAVSRKMALNMNTNIIIQNIYNSIPPVYRHGIYAKNRPGNPLSYYEAIIRYLGDNAINILNVNHQMFNTAHWGKDWEEGVHTSMSNQLNNNLPDIIIFEFNDEHDDPQQAFASNIKSNKPQEFTIKGSDGSAQYTLDSCIIRDTNKHHFASALTCNKKQFGFDGISFSRLNPFSWKKLINTNKNWTFSGSDTEWNFRNAYQILFYYRN